MKDTSTGVKALKTCHVANNNPLASAAKVCGHGSELFDSLDGLQSERNVKFLIF